MAIKVITGAPGAGKSYYAMREVVLKHFDYDNEFHEWKPKENKNFTLITNIEKLKLPHENLEKLLKKFDITYREFFTVDFIRSYTEENGPIVILLDEAQRYFPKDFKDDRSVTGGNDPTKSVFYFFEYHRHLQCDVYLMAQMWTRLHPNIVGLCEYQIDAVRRTLSVTGEFRYRLMSGFDVLSTVVFRPDKKIFALYQSFEGDQENQGQTIRPIRKYLILIGIACLCVVGLFYYSVSRFFPESSPPPIKKQATETPTLGAVGRVPSPVPVPVLESPTETKTIQENTQTIEPDPLVKVVMSGIVINDDIYQIYLDGVAFKPSEFPYRYFYDKPSRNIYALLPQDVYVPDSIRSQQEIDYSASLNNISVLPDQQNSFPIQPSLDPRPSS